MKAPTGQDEGTAADRGGRRSRRRFRRWRWGIAAAAMLAAAIAIAIFDRQSRKPLLPIDYPLESVEDEPAFVAEAKASSQTLNLYIESVSFGGQWVAFRADPLGGALRWYFDVEQKRFVQRLPFSPKADPSIYLYFLGGEHWTPDRMVIMAFRTKKGAFESFLGRFNIDFLSSPYRPVTAYYRVNGRDRSVRVLVEYGPTGKRDAWSLAILSRDGSRLLHALLPGQRVDDVEYRLRDLSEGIEHVVPGKDLDRDGGKVCWPWDWLPDNRTAVFFTNNMPPLLLGDIPEYRLETLYLVDSTRVDPPRRFPILLWFRLRRFGHLLGGEEGGSATHAPAFIALLGFFGEPLKARLAVRFQATPSSTDPATDRAGIWDLDLDTGQLSKLIDLPMGIARESAVLASPSGTRFLAVPSSETLAGDTGSTAVSPVLYEIDHPPKQLPVKVEWMSQIRLNFARMRFLDDNSLIYIQNDCEIRRFHLNTWKSEFLWKPENKTSRAK